MKPVVPVSQHICCLSAGVIHHPESCSMSPLPAAWLNRAVTPVPEWLSIPHLSLVYTLDGCFQLGPGDGQHTFQLRWGPKSPLINATEGVSREDLELGYWISNTTLFTYRFFEPG